MTSQKKILADFNGLDSDPLVTEQQARYAGAIGARAIYKLRSFSVENPEIIYDSKTYTIVVYHLGVIRLYSPSRNTAWLSSKALT